MIRYRPFSDFSREQAKGKRSDRRTRGRQEKAGHRGCRLTWLIKSRPPPGFEELLLEEVRSYHLQECELVPADILEVHAWPIWDFESLSVGFPAMVLQLPRGRVHILDLVD